MDRFRVEQHFEHERHQQQAAQHRCAHQSRAEGRLRHQRHGDRNRRPEWIHGKPLIELVSPATNRQRRPNADVVGRGGDVPQCGPQQRLQTGAVQGARGAAVRQNEQGVSPVPDEGSASDVRSALLGR